DPQLGRLDEALEARQLELADQHRAGRLRGNATYLAPAFCSSGSSASQLVTWTACPLMKNEGVPCSCSSSDWVCERVEMSVAFSVSARHCIAWSRLMPRAAKKSIKPAASAIACNRCAGGAFCACSSAGPFA